MASSTYRHCMRIKRWDFAVLGLADPLDGRGAGSFCNHSYRVETVNVAPVVMRSPPQRKDPWAWNYFGSTSQTSSDVDRARLPILYMVAIRDIGIGEELRWKYPKQTLLRFGLPVAGQEDDEEHPESNSPLEMVPREDELQPQVEGTNSLCSCQRLFLMYCACVNSSTLTSMSIQKSCHNCTATSKLIPQQQHHHQNSSQVRCSRR